MIHGNIQIVAAFGIAYHTPLQVSEALRSLRMSHTIAGGFRYLQMDVDGLARVQPVWPAVVDVKGVSRLYLTRSPVVLFVCDSLAALMDTNVDRSFIDEAVSAVVKVKRALLSIDFDAHWKFRRKEATVADYVAVASKPSFLSNIQTAIYKINPYALRKEVQNLAIQYLASNVGVTKLKSKLNSSVRLEPLAQLMLSPKAQDLKEAVRMYQRTQDVEVVAKDSGFATFELLYIVKSAEKQSKG